MTRAPKNKTYRIAAAIISAILLLLCLTVMAAATEPVKTTTAESRTPTAATEAETPTEPATEAPTESEPETEVPTESAESEPRNMFRFTPDGSLTLIDDFEYLVDVDGSILSKQFITVQSRDGSYFYIIIDRNGETENVYFLNQVDLADLKALVNGEPQPIQETECTCTTACVPGSINMSCPVCATNMTECAAITDPGKAAGKDDEKKDDPSPTEAEEPAEAHDPNAPKKSMSPYLALGLIVVIIAGVLLFVFKDKLKAGRLKKKLPDFDFDDEEDDSELEADPAPIDEEPESSAENTENRPAASSDSDCKEDYDFQDDEDLM